MVIRMLAGIGGAMLAGAAVAAPTAAPLVDSALLARGRYLVEVVAMCGACHTPQGADGHAAAGMALAGGSVFHQRGWQAVLPNITPDPETGIGRWTTAEIVEAVRNGRRPDGRLIGPPMPTAMYRELSDRDANAIAAWLQQVPPVRHAVAGKSRYPFELTALDRVEHVAEPAETPAARGRYLAAAAHCLECHTPPLPGERRDWARLGAGEVPFAGPWGLVASRNITSSTLAGIGGWSDARIVTTLTTGISGDGHKLIPPMSGRAATWSRLTAGDMRDLIAYLRTIPPQE